MRFHRTEKFMLNFFLLLFGCLFAINSVAQPLPITAQTTSYLSREMPPFEFSLDQFQQQFNLENPTRQLSKFSEVSAQRSRNLAYYVSPMTPTLYASAVVDIRRNRLKSIQFTYLPSMPLAEQKPAIATNLNRALFDSLQWIKRANSLTLQREKQEAIAYMVALIQWSNPLLEADASQSKMEKMLTLAGKEQIYLDTANNLRYIVVSQDKKGITLAIESIKHNNA